MSQLDSILQEYTNEKVLPCAFGAVVTRDKGLVYANAFGLKDITDESSVVNLDTTLSFFSCTKSVATTALLQLLEKGLIQSIDDPVEKYVSEIKDIKILEGFDANDLPILKKPKNKPTIRHLLTHTAGFSYSFFSFRYKKLLDLYGYPNIINSTWKDFNTPFIFEPGTKWHYGTNIDWVGKIVQTVTKMSLGEYCRQNIFNLIGAKTLTFQKSEKQAADSVEIHQRNETGDIYPLKNLMPDHVEFEAGGHGLYGTLTDFMKFLEIFLHQGECPSTGKQILKPKTVKNYSLTNILPKNVFVESTLELSQPDLSHKVNVFDAYPKELQGWTASFHKVDIESPTGRSKGSVNWCGLANLYYWIDVDKGIIGMFATQLFPFLDKPTLKAFKEFETQAYNLYT